MHRNRASISVALALLLLVAAIPQSFAQLLNKEAPVIVGHYHLNVTSVAEHKKFWVDTLGGTATTFGPDKIEVIKFPGILLFLRVQRPTGPTRGTAFDHIGFAVPNVPEVAARAVANGYKLTVGREPGPGQTVAPPTAGDYGRFAYLVGPDGVKVELVTSGESNAPPIVHHHVKDPADRVGDVAHLTARRSDHRPDIRRPAPTRIQPDPTDGDLVELGELEEAGSERPRAIGLVERFPLEPGHAARF